jgi:hypothetical protein
MKSVLTHQVLSETLSVASIHKHDTLRVNVGDVHGGTLHFGEREAHLHVDVVHVLQEVGKVSASCSDRQIVTAKIYRDKRDCVNCHLWQAVCSVLLGVFYEYGLVSQWRSALHLDFV